MVFDYSYVYENKYTYMWNMEALVVHEHAESESRVANIDIKSLYVL